jgi:hypothetical protein
VTGKTSSFGLVAALAFSASVTGNDDRQNGRWRTRPLAATSRRSRMLRNGADVNTAQETHDRPSLGGRARRPALAGVLIYSGPT